MTGYNEDPVEVAREFASACAEMIHVVDLDGAFNGSDSPNRAVVREIIEAIDVPIEFGGGIRSIDDIKRNCDASVARVVVGSVASESPVALQMFKNKKGTQNKKKIDSRDGRVMSRGWE